MSVRRVRRLFAFPVLVLFFMSATVQPGFAGIVSTEQVFSQQYAQDARVRVEAFLAREDVQAQLEAHGVDPSVAAARVANLTDAEIAALAERIDNDPAGQSAVGTLVFAGLVVFLVLLFTDIIGETDVFDFDD